MLFVECCLTGNAVLHTGQGFAARLGNRFATFMTEFSTFAVAQCLTRAVDGVFDGRVNLILNGTVLCPSTCHKSSKSIENGPMIFTIGPLHSKRLEVV
ncbi:Uncharacterised protein [Ewingella americana]|uniref:Uncharacterized protein n=1 Tax=Ewingella americana TaxID=41202 RepID=A0A377NF35_9GAMM|nr:Uncharacterised protein [Ewingella americana]